MTYISKEVIKLQLNGNMFIRSTAFITLTIIVLGLLKQAWINRKSLLHKISVLVYMRTLR